MDELLERLATGEPRFKIVWPWQLGKKPKPIPPGHYTATVEDVTPIIPSRDGNGVIHIELSNIKPVKK